MATKTSLAKTTDEWEDSLGQKITPGDFIAVATISGRSPQMVVAQIVRLNTHDKDGKHFGCSSKAYPAVACDEDAFKPHTVPRHGGGSYTYGPSLRTVTITATPLFDGRGFGRSRGKWALNPTTGHYEHDGSDKVRDSTYRIIGNVVRLEVDQVIAMIEKQELEALEQEIASE